MYNFTFIFIFSITLPGFNQKINTLILDIVSITRPHIFLSEIHLKFVLEFLFLRFLIDRWSIDRRSVVGWSCGRLSMISGWLVGGFKKTLTKKP